MPKIKGLFNFRFTFLFSLTIILILIISINNYVLLQFKKFESESNINNEEYSPEILIKNLFSQYYSYLNIGNPPQKTEVHISYKDLGLFLKEDICLTSNYYNKNKSLSLSQTSYYNYNENSKKVIIINETIDFPVFNTTTKNLSQVIIPDYIFHYMRKNKTEGEEEKIEKDKEGKACAVLGFKIVCEFGLVVCNNIPGYLKRNKLTNSYNFFFLFHDNEEKKINGGYDFSLLIGENPHKMNQEKYHEQNYMLSKALTFMYEKAWTLDFFNFYYYNGNKIQFNFTKYDLKIKATFWFDLDFIIGMFDYYKSIKQNYFDKYQKECNISVVNKQYYVISCDVNFNPEKFPTLYFHNTDYNFTFELTHKDLFQIRGNRKYFLIIFDLQSNYPWKFGKIFMQKYFFNFNVDSSTIGFYTDLYNSNSEINNKSWYNSQFIFLIFSIILIIIGVGCFLLGKYIYKKNPKRKANELDDDYEYTQNDKKESLKQDSKKDDDKLGIN